MSDNAEMDALEAELVHGRAMGDLAAVRAQRIESLTEQLAAAQAVIAEVQASVLSGLSDCEPDYGDYEVSGRWVYDTLSQSPTDALQAHDRQVAEKAWDDCLDAIEEHELNTEQARLGNPHRAIVSEPSAPEHSCESCEDCLHDGVKCCGCHDGVCCQEGQATT